MAEVEEDGGGGGRRRWRWRRRAGVDVDRARHDRVRRAVIRGTGPASLNVYENVWRRGQERRSRRTPVSDVTVCVSWPVFVQQTVVPGGTVTCVRVEGVVDDRNLRRASRAARAAVEEVAAAEVAAAGVADRCRRTGGRPESPARTKRPRVRSSPRLLPESTRRTHSTRSGTRRCRARGRRCRRGRRRYPRCPSGRPPT